MSENDYCRRIEALEKKLQKIKNHYAYFPRLKGTDEVWLLKNWYEKLGEILKEKT